jgi:inosine-uridine nucleoside N-ribohydrolase
MLSSNLSKRVIIDTDCGVDDAVAILWALTAHITSQKAFGSCQLLAITCCSGNTHCTSRKILFDIFSFRK